MRIVSWIREQSYKPYRKMAEMLEASVKKHGYDFTLYPATSDDVSNCLIDKKLYVKCLGRPAFLRKVLDGYPNEDIAWMDIDCIMREPFGDVLDDCDTAFTIRKIEDRNSHHLAIFKYINCGVMFFKNNQAARDFIGLWSRQINPDVIIGSDDQTALNNLLLKYSTLEQYNEIVDVEGIRVKILDARIYNFFYFPEEPNGAKVLHYKGFSYKKERVYEHCQAA